MAIEFLDFFTYFWCGWIAGVYTKRIWMPFVVGIAIHVFIFLVFGDASYCTTLDDRLGFWLYRPLTLLMGIIAGYAYVFATHTPRFIGLLYTEERKYRIDAAAIVPMLLMIFAMLILAGVPSIIWEMVPHPWNMIVTVIVVPAFIVFQYFAFRSWSIWDDFDKNGNLVPCEYNPWFFSFWFFVHSIIIVLLYTIVEWATPTHSEWWVFIGVGLFVLFLGIAFVIHMLKRMDAPPPLHNVMTQWKNQTEHNRAILRARAIETAHKTASYVPFTKEC